MKKIIILTLMLIGISMNTLTMDHSYKNSELMSYFIRDGLNKQDRETGATKLHMAVLSKNTGLVEDLIVEGASRDIPDNDGVTARQLMMRSSNRKIRALASVELAA